MKRKEYLQSKKFYLKGLASQITSLKADLKQAAREQRFNDEYKLIFQVKKAKYEFRHEHIAYCLVRKVKGDIYDGNMTDEAIERYYQIENKVKDGNEANFDYIRQLVEEYPVVQEVHDETLVHLDAE